MQSPHVSFPQLTIPQLGYLVAIADSSTWASAAAGLGVSPSALSQGIAELERRLGLPLFERNGRRRILTEQASPVLTYARDVVAKTQDLGRWLDERGTAGSGILRVGMIDTAALHYFSDALRQFRLRYPNVDIRLTVAPSGQLVEQVHHNKLDFAVAVRPSVQPNELSFETLIGDPMAVYMPDDDGPTNHRTTDRKQTPGTWGPWVAFPDTSHTRIQIVQHLEELGSGYAVVAESNQPAVLCEMVRLGIGWAVLPVVQAEAGPHPLRRATNDLLFSRPLVAVRRTHVLPHPNAEALLGLLGT